MNEKPSPQTAGMEWGGVVSDLLEIIEHIRGNLNGFELRSFGSLPLATHDKHSDSTAAYDICLTFNALSQTSRQSSEVVVIIPMWGN